MNSSRRTLLFALVLLLLSSAAPMSAIAQADSVTIGVAPTSVVGAGMFTVSGNVTAATGNVAGTAVFIEVQNPSSTNVAVSAPAVTGSGASGTYTATFTAGGPSWTSGTYKVAASYGTTTSAPAMATTSFAYSAGATNTTSTTTTSTTSTHTISTTTSTVTITSVSTETLTSTTTSVSTATTTQVAVTTTTSTTTTTEGLVVNLGSPRLLAIAVLVVMAIVAVGVVLGRRRRY